MTESSDNDGRVLTGSPVVYVNGQRYVAEGETAPRIGVGISTHNRRVTADETIEEWRRRLPAGAVMVVVDDASEVPFPDADYRFEETAGVARTKNKCLELLDGLGVEHIFLSDDDIYPLVDDWWEPYVACTEPHLMWMFDKPRSDPGGTQLRELYRNEEIVAYHATRGCLLYVERRVLDVVGGMDPAFGTWGWEHTSWSDRVHMAGLTTARYMDVVNSGGMFHSMDREGEVTSTASDEARAFSDGPGLELRMMSRHSSHYIEFREQRDAVLTCLMTDHNDPQRTGKMRNDPSMVEDLRTSLSISPDTGLVVIHTGNLVVKGAEMVPVKQRFNVYFERWLHYYQWLREHREVRFVWCVDATDVQMVRDPFPEMEPGHLYLGWEPKTLRDEWMLRQHPDATLQEWMRGNPNLPLLNMGVVGGDRDTVMSFAHYIVQFWFDDHIDWIMGWEKSRAGVGDMATGNYVAYTQFGDELSSGPHVTNVFKSNTVSPTAWWKHR